MIARGRVTRASASWAEVEMPSLALGSHVRIGGAPAEVVGSNAGCMRVALQSAGDGALGAGAEVREDWQAGPVLGTALLGRVVDACGRAIDGRGPIAGPRVPRLFKQAPPASRRSLTEPLWTGVRAIDGLLTIGRGARVGIFGAPGAGKSTLLETIVDGTQADAVVLILVGERGREAHDWMLRCSAKTTIVCATSDRPPGERVAAAQFGLAQARYLASRGLDVLVILDSLARVAYALRERAGATSEPVGRGGYPPSVFATIASLVETGGRFEQGSISMIATVLSDGDDRDPVSESARSLLDGHIVLSSTLACAGRYPAIDVVESASRTMNAVVSPQHACAAAVLRAKLAHLRDTAEARALGIQPADPDEPEIERFLRQGPAPEKPAATLAMLSQIADNEGKSHEYYV